MSEDKPQEVAFDKDRSTREISQVNPNIDLSKDTVQNRAREKEIPYTSEVDSVELPLDLCNLRDFWQNSGKLPDLASQGFNTNRLDVTHTDRDLRGAYVGNVA